jgi:hypothetical protein
LIRKRSFESWLVRIQHSNVLLGCDHD